MSKQEKKEVLRNLENLKNDAISLWEKMDDRHSKEKIDNEIEKVRQVYQQLKELIQQKPTVTREELEKLCLDISETGYFQEEIFENIKEFLESKNFTVKK